MLPGGLGPYLAGAARLAALEVSGVPLGARDLAALSGALPALRSLRLLKCAAGAGPQGAAIACEPRRSRLGDEGAGLLAAALAQGFGQEEGSAYDDGDGGYGRLFAEACAEKATEDVAVPPHRLCDK